MVAMLSARSAVPYMPDMPMHPRPMADTIGPVDPSCRLSMTISSLDVRFGFPRGSCRPGVDFARRRCRDRVAGGDPCVKPAVQRANAGEAVIHEELGGL